MPLLFPTKTTQFDLIDSTMNEARRLIESGQSVHGHFILAHEQTQGRGRLGRHWISLKGNLMGSLILEMDCPLTQASELSFVSALAMGETVKSFVSNNAHVWYKWPNDVLVNGFKVAGILLEAFEFGLGRHKKLYLIIGLSLNIQTAPNDVKLRAKCPSRVF